MKMVVLIKFEVSAKTAPPGKFWFLIYLASRLAKMVKFAEKGSNRNFRNFVDDLIYFSLLTLTWSEVYFYKRFQEKSFFLPRIYCILNFSWDKPPKCPSVMKFRLGCEHHISVTSGQNFHHICIKSEYHKPRRVTRPDFSWKVLFCRKFRKHVKKVAKLACWLWSSGSEGISVTVGYFFLIFCMKSGDNKCRKVTWPEFCRKLLFSLKFQNCVKIGLFSRFLDFFSKFSHTLGTFHWWFW